MNWDINLFHFLNGFASHYSWLDWIIIFIGEYYFYFLLAILAFLLVWSYSKDKSGFRTFIISIFSALIARFGVAVLIRFFYPRQRPFLALQIPHLITDYSYSFPSGHTIFIFALATAIFPRYKRLSYFFFASGLIVGVARIVGGVHYPSDILGGIVFGIIVGLLINFIQPALFPKELAAN